MLLDRRKAWFIHGGHSRTVSLLREATNVDMHGHRANARAEVEHPFSTRTEPVAKVESIGQCCGQTDEADRCTRLCSDEAHTTYDHFKHGPAINPQKVASLAAETIGRGPVIFIASAKVFLNVLPSNYCEFNCRQKMMANTKDW